MHIRGHMVMQVPPGSGDLRGADFPGRVELRLGSLTIEGDRIVSVSLDDAAADDAQALGGDDWIVCPGFTDAHLHLPQFDSIGRAGMTLLDWLSEVVFPAEARWADAVYAREMGARVAEQLLAHGTTGVGAYGTVHHAGTIAAMESLDRAGISGIVGQVLMDREAPAELLLPAERLLAEAAALPEIGRIRPAVTPRFAISCTPELLQGAGRLAQERGQYVQTHLAETIPECDLVRRLFGMKYVEVYLRAGLLGPRTILGHGIHLSKGDRAALAESGAMIAHCPTANSFLRSGAMDLHACRGQSSGGLPAVGIALGSDIAGGYERSMVRVARAAIETASRLHPERAWPDAAWGWWQITAGNAAAIGDAAAGGAKPPRGRIALGAAADLVLIKPDVRWRESGDPLSMLMYGWDDRWVKRVVRGA